MVACLLSVIGVSAFFEPMTHTLWFVEMILFFYLLYPILWSRKSERIILKSSIVYLGILLLNGWVLNVDVRFFYYFPCFVLGLVLPSTSFDLWKKSWMLFLSVLCFFLVLAFAINRGECQGIAYCLLMAVISALGTHVIVYVSNLFSKQCPKKMILFVSYISMAAYMFHRQILFVIYHIYWPEDGIGRLLYLLFVCMPIVVLLAYAIQKIYDKLLSYKVISRFV